MTARVAPFLEAIQKARDAGFTWADIAQAIGANSGETVRRAVRICKYRTEQIPLPDRECPQKTTASASVDAPRREQQHPAPQAPQTSSIKRLTL
jgi:hypothetical protein